MQDKKQWADNFYKGLKILDKTTFPKTCSNCGKTFSTLQEFIAQTDPVSSSGLMEMTMPGKPTTVGLFRNCRCHSTIIACLDDRREPSLKNKVSREQFGKLLDMLMETGMERDIARAELLKILNGGQSEILESKGIDIRSMLE